MIHIPIVTAELVTTQELKEWLLSLPNSRWDDDQDTGCGYVTIDDCWLMIPGDTQLNQFYYSEEITALTAALGSAPISGLEIIHKAGPAFPAAAMQMARRILAKWKSVLADDIIGP